MRIFLIQIICLYCCNLWALHYQFSPEKAKIDFEIGQFTFSSLKGHFKSFSGRCDFDPDSKAITNFQVSIDAKSIDTKNVERDTHLKNEDFFHTEEFPQILFTGRQFIFDGDRLKKIAGEIFLRGVKKNIVFEVENWQFSDSKVSFVAKTSLYRRDFGIKYGVFAVIGNEVDIEVSYN